MKFFKSLIIVLLMLTSFAFAQPSLADKPKFLKNPDYIEVTKALNSLLSARDTQDQTEGASPEEIQKKIDALEFQKNTLESGLNWGQCRNETGKTIAVYGPKPDFDDDDYDYQYDNALYFLANGQTTKQKWDCNGVYLPAGVKSTAISADAQELTQAVAVKIVDGTQLVIKTNPDTNAVEFNVPPAQVFKAGDTNWFIPNVSQAMIDSRVPNAPISKMYKAANLVARRNPEPVVVQSNPPAEPQVETVEAQPRPEVQPETQPKPQSILQRSGLYRKQ